MDSDNTTTLLSTINNGNIVTHLMSIINKSFQKGCSKKTIINAISNIIISLFVKSLIDKNVDYIGVISSKLRLFIFSLLFTRKVVSAIKLDKKMISSDGWHFVGKFPLRREDNNVYYIPFFHNDFVDDVSLKLKEKTSNYSLDTKKDSILLKKIVPKELYPSKNFLRLEASIIKHIRVSELLGTFDTLSLIINGEPGLGKTSFSEYISHKNIFDSIVLVDMTKLIKHDFSDICKKALNLVNSKRPHLVIFDELDKYISVYLENAYSSIPLKAREDKDLFIKNQKEEFLYKILSLMSYSDSKVIFMYCCNNFDSIFEDIETRHFNSLKDRFISIDFERCDKTEITEYIRWINEKFVGTEYHREFDETKIPDRKITYRRMSHLLFKSGYNIDVFCEKLIDEKSEPSSLIGSLNSSPIIKKKALVPKEEVLNEEEQSGEEHDIEDSGEEEDSEREAFNKIRVVKEESSNEEDSEDDSDSEDSEVEIEESNTESIHDEYKRQKINNKKEKDGEFIVTVREYLAKCENASGKQAKAAVIEELFDYLIEHKEIIHTDRYKKLRTAMRAKMNEFRGQKEFREGYIDEVERKLEL